MPSNLSFQPRQSRLPDVLAMLLVLAWTLAAYTLAARQHESFHTHAFDMAYFDNVLWNTSQGRLFANDLPDKPRNFLGEHFSPALVALAPLYWLWSDPRSLLAAQALALALSLVPAYLLVRPRHPRLALLVLFGLSLNPALLGVALSEFHEISLAAPLVAFGLWALLQRRYLLTASLFVCALATKEEFAVTVAAVGVYLVFAARTNPPARRAVVAGIVLIALAASWLAFVWGVLPLVLADAVSHWSLRYGDIAPTPWAGLRRLLSDPAFLWSRYAVTEKWFAVARVLAPIAFLPLLSPSIAALAIPAIGYLLLSNKRSVSQLDVWYVTPLLPILFVAAAWTVSRAASHRALVMSVGLVAFAAWGYWQFGEGPLAQGYEPARFAVTERTACGHQLLSLIPADATISAQDNLLPHLAHRQALWVFPSMGEPLAEYVAIDARVEIAGGYSNWPTVRPLEVPAFVNRFLSDPTYDLIGDGCDFKVLRYTGHASPTIALPVLYGARQYELLGYDVAVADKGGVYRRAGRNLTAGQDVRVTLWWRGFEVRPDVTVFVHALTAAGRLAAQHDSPPANGTRPASTWESGVPVRDLHYFTLETDASRLAVGLYDPRTGTRVPLASGGDAVMIPLAP